MGESDFYDSNPEGRSVSSTMRGERRAQAQHKARHGMQVNGTSVKVLATIIPKSKRRKRKKGKQ